MEIKPKVGVDDLRFGMTRTEVISILGEPDRSFTDGDDENELQLEWNDIKLRLTFYQNHNDRFGYLRTKNQNLTFEGKKILEESFEIVRTEVFGNVIEKWECDDYGTFLTYFNDKYWLTCQVEYGIVSNVEMGVPFKNEEEYEWAV